MAAKFIPIGEVAHDSERQALWFLVEGLSPEYTVYGNAWLVKHTGVVYELDAVVVAPHAIYVVEIKSYRGRIEGTDHDWYIPHPVPSPLKKNRICAQVLNGVPGRNSVDTLYGWAGWTPLQRLKAILAIDEELEEGGAPLADRIALLDSAWRLLPDVSREDPTVASRLKDELQALLVATDGPGKDLLEDWRKRFPFPGVAEAAAGTEWREKRRRDERGARPRTTMPR